MTYLDYGATSFHKPPQVSRAMDRALRTCANPGRGGYAAAREADRVYQSREEFMRWKHRLYFLIRSKKRMRQ